MAVKNIVFDMGGVLIDFDPVRSVANHFENCYHDAVMENTFRSPEWQLMDKGTLNVDDALTVMCSRLPVELHAQVREMVLEREKEMPPISGMYPIVKALKENGYKIYLLSNCPAWFDSFKKSVPAFDFFDGFIISALYNQIKPDEEIYHTLLNEFSLKSDECFFIDDSPANIEAAKKLKMHTYCFKDKNFEELKSAMRKNGVKI